MFRFVTTSLLWALLSSGAAYGASGGGNGSIRRRDQSAEIVGGTVASHSDYPWFVSLTQGCGGTLVHEDIVLTAAHCNSGSFSARVGPSRTSAGISSKVVHPSYSSSSFRNDFMILKLDSSFSSISLPNINSNGGTPSGTQDIVVVGYGATSEGGSQSSQFREVTLQHVSYDQCNSAYNGDIDQGTMFCAGVDGGGMDSCQGDSGGPLVIGNTLVGVVSWGIGCAREEYPGVNARVSSASSWIDNWICCLSDNAPGGCSCDDSDGNVDSGSGGGGGGGGLGACFSGDNLVQVQGTGNVLMSELQVGDRVLTSAESYEPVYAFGHRHETVKTTFVKFLVESGSWLEMTGAHLIHVKGKAHPVRADSVEVGESLVGKEGENLMITKIKEVNKKGIYAPLTASGNLVVNSLIASSYVSMQDNADEYVQLASTNMMLSQAGIAHLWMTPLRMLCTRSNHDLCSTLDEDGLSPWVALGFDFTAWGETQSLLLQVIMLLATLAGLVVFMVLEAIANLSPSTFVVVSLAVLAAHRTKGLHTSFSGQASKRLFR